MPVPNQRAKARPSALGGRMKEKLYIVAFLLPSLIIFGVFMVYPVLQNVELSFYSWNMVSPNKNYVGLENYLNLFTDADFAKALGNTGIYVLLLLLMIFVLPYGVAYILGQLVKKGSHFYRAVLFFPSLLSFVVAAVIFNWILNPLSGPLAELLALADIESPYWFRTPGLVIFALSFITAWRAFGYNFIVFLGAVVEVPQEMIEAARLEKASDWTVFWQIILPMTSPTALFVFIMTITFGLSYVFTPINILTQGGPTQASTNIIYLIYQYGFDYFQTGRAAATAIVTLVIFMVLVVIQKKLEKRVHYEN